jgi:hypothetical protein
MVFSRRRPDGSWEHQDGQLCNRLSITSFTQYHIRVEFERCCPSVQTVALLLHVIFIIRNSVQTILPWRPDGCNSSPRLALSRIASGQCRLDVRANAAVFPYLCLRRKSDCFSNIDERMDMLLRRPDRCNLEQFETFRQ